MGRCPQNGPQQAGGAIDSLAADHRPAQVAQGTNLSFERHGTRQQEENTVKITSFNPIILTKKPEEAIALFEALGFERRHNKIGETTVGDQGMGFSTVRMKNAGGFYVDVCTADTDRLERDLTVIRMNVDDFDEAAELLKNNDFRESKVIGQNYTSSSKYAYFVSPSGFIIDLIKHIKKEDV